MLAILNESKLFKSADAEAAVRACESQIKLHVAPIWEMLPASIVYYEDRKLIPKAADLVVILNDSDHAGALGYHKETPEGKPYGRAFVRPVLDHGGTALSGNMSVSSVVSHEVCEWFVDRFLNLWADGPGGEYPLEICDPVQENSYDIGGVAVSNFVTKRYFDRLAPARTQFDYLNKLVKPFTFTPGGYLLVRKSGVVRQVFGDRYAPWKKKLQDFPAARSYRRRLAPIKEK